MIKVLICHSPQPRVVYKEELILSPGTTVLEALQALQALRSFDNSVFLESPYVSPRLKIGHLASVWSRPVDLTHVLRDLDRIEILRPIKVDPKVARRERFKKQGTKGAGLFAKQRPGSKAGY